MREVSRDLIGEFSGDINLFSFVGNGPVPSYDLFGWEKKPIRIDPQARFGIAYLTLLRIKLSRF